MHIRHGRHRLSHDSHRLLSCPAWCVVRPSQQVPVPSTSSLTTGAAPTQHVTKRTIRRRFTVLAAQSAEAPSQQDTPKPVADGVLLCGFTADDLTAVYDNLSSVFPGLDPSRVGVVSKVLAAQAAHTLAATMPLTLEQAVTHMQPQVDEHDGSAAAATVRYGRVVYFLGNAGVSLASSINDALLSVGVAPAVVGAMQPRHANMTIAEVCDSLRTAHAQYWQLMRPAQLAGELPQLLSSWRAAAGPIPSATQTHSNCTSTTPSNPPPTDHVLAPLASASVILAATLDAGEVPTSTGSWRLDEAHVVALDGLLTEAERQELLDWLTTPGHDHSGPPPEDKWEQACADREGDPVSWGLRQEVLEQLETNPPPPMIALQTRLAALYPEYVIAHMPADVISGTEEGALSAFVGNAVMQGDPCAWHDDCDPAVLSPASPWVHCYGYYYNREPGRPRFVSVLLYLNESWPEELHAETMFLDGASQTGLFVRPAPGRVVLMDQDMPHRISAPSRAAGGAPRYSLVWKMVWFPRDEPTCRSSGGDSVSQGHAVEPGSSGDLPGLCRTEWGAPIRLGSAGEILGRPVWR